MKQEAIPKISIVIPVYNVREFLRECLDSVLAQTFTDWEAIVVDDGSTDGSGEICDEYSARDSRFRVIHKKNGGLSSARNAALEIARGEYFGFVDSDDWIEPEMFGTLVADLEKNGADIAKCAVRIVARDYSKIKSAFSNFRVIGQDEAVRLIYEDRLINNYAWDKLYRRSIFDIRFPEGQVFEDMRIMLRIAGNAKKMTVNPAPLYNYRMRSGSIVNVRSIEYVREYIDTIEARFTYVMRMNIKDWTPLQKWKVFHKAIIKACRDIARYYPYNKESDRFINDMRHKIMSSTLSQMVNLGPKYMLRICELKYFPALFKGTVRLSGKKFGRHRRNLF